MQPIIVERVMYLPGPHPLEGGHESAGVLLANPNPAPAEVDVTFLKSGVTVSRSYALQPTSRVNIWVNGDVPELGQGTFSADIRIVNFQPIAGGKGAVLGCRRRDVGRRHERDGDAAAATVRK